ncbi:MAG: insulinase family protein [Planctomycetia bacterium]|nr:insulinase family protein [Planctomycetia bacterium]
MSIATDVEFREAVLPNGLTVQAEIVPGAMTSAAGFFFRTGARDEASSVMGVSHFLEHMMFKGTERRTAEDVNRGFDDLGANHNAFTTTEITAYYAHVPYDAFDDAFDILADILRPSLRTEDFDEEKGVILEEIAMYDDQPFWVLFEQGLERYFGSHPLAHRVLGTRQTVGDLQRDQMKAYFDRRYSADNGVLVASGRVDFDDLVARTEALCGHWPKGEPGRVHVDPEFVPGEIEVDLPDTQQRYIMLLAPAVGIADPRKYPMAQAFQALGDSDGSTFFWELVETGLAEEATMHLQTHEGCGEAIATIVCASENAEQVESIARREMARLASTVDEDALVRSRAKIATSAMLASERPMGRMTRLGSRWSYGLDYATLDDELAKIGAVGLDDIREALDSLPLDRLLAVRGGG